MSRRAIGLAALLAWSLAASAAAADYEGKRVLHIDSYHRGNTCNDRIADAGRDTLAGTGIELKIIHLDTKRNPSEEFNRAAALEAERAGRAEQAVAPAASRSILVVEDEPKIARMLVGHRVEVAATGRQALERLNATRFDLVLTDLRMPDLDGSHLFRELETRDPAQAARLIFLTGDSLNASAESVAAETRRPVIQKPFTPEQVRRVVAEQLERA